MRAREADPNVLPSMKLLMPKIDNKAASGLTLVELIVAMAIVSMLLATAMFVLGKLSRSSQVQTGRHDKTLIDRPLRDLLSSDLSQATHYRKTASGFQLKSSSLLDAGTLEPHHWGAVIEYRAAQVGGHACLLRRQVPVGPEKSLDELVCVGPTAIALEAAPDASGPAPATQNAQDTTWQPMPGTAAVTVVFEDGREPIAFDVWNRER